MPATGRLFVALCRAPQVGLALAVWADAIDCPSAREAVQSP
jgi:hypothetical protein